MIVTFVKTMISSSLYISVMTRPALVERGLANALLEAEDLAFAFFQSQTARVIQPQLTGQIWPVA